MGVITALGELLSPQYLLMMIAGTMGGIMIGAMPGLTSVMGVTLLLPFTYGMDPAAGISMLLAISFGAIYGGSITAILIGALTLQGLQPGPQLFTEHMDIVNRIFASTLVANFLFLVLGLLGVRLFIKVIQIKPYILTPIIFVLCILGSYALRNNMFDVGAMLLIAVVGYFFLKLEIPIAPIVLALILGPLAESNLRRSLLLSQGSASIFFTRPICIFFLVLALVSLCWPLLRKLLSGRKKQA